MEDEFFDDTYQVITMTSEDGDDVECFIIDAISTEDGETYILVVVCEDFDEDTTEAFILKQIGEEGEDVVYLPIEDDAEYNKALILLQENDTNYEMEF